MVQLKKTISTLNTGFRLAIANDGVSRLEDTNLIGFLYSDAHIGRGSNDSPMIATNASFPHFDRELRRYFKVLNTYYPNKFKDSKGFSIKCDGHPGYKHLDGVCPGDEFPFSNGYYTMILADGSIVYLMLFDNHNKYKSGTIGGKRVINNGFIRIDVNGSKSPNQYGRDFFEFNLSSDGTIFSELFYDDYWEPDFIDTHCNTNTDDGRRADTCGARVLKDGFVMNY